MAALLLLGLAVAFGPREAEAQFQPKVGSFVAPTGGGPNQNQSVTGLGFMPRAVIKKVGILDFENNTTYREEKMGEAVAKKLSDKLEASQRVVIG